MNSESDLIIDGVKLHLLIDRQEITSRVMRLAEQLSIDYAGKKPIFLCVLNGSFIFASDLVRRFTGNCEVCFIKMASYDGDTSTGKMKIPIGLPENLAGRHVIVVEDIVDTGFTMKNLKDMLHSQATASVRLASLFIKPTKLKYDVKVDYCAFEIPDDFIVGYGLDYNGLYRNLPDIYAK